MTREAVRVTELIDTLREFLSFHGVPFESIEAVDSRIIIELTEG